MNGVQFGARFSIATNRRKFCGPEDAEPDLYRAIVRGERLEEAERALSRFEALYPYLQAIGAKHGRMPFDREVVEAYWVGNRLLDGFTREDFRGILIALTRRGLPPFLARELAERLPPNPIPHHVFHVGFVGVGSVTGHVETTLPNMEACRPSWGEVLEVRPRELLVRQPHLGVAGGKIVLGGVAEVVLPFDPLVLPGLRKGDRIASHWSWPALQLDPVQASDLESYTARSLQAANEARPPPSPPKDR